MKVKSVVFVFVWLLLSCLPVFAAELMLPFSGGETWRCDQENNDTPTHSGNLQYAWDFNLGSGNDDLGKPVIAPASGTIVYARNSNTDWGNTVIIDYGDNSFGKLAHLQRIDVSENQNVIQGQQIGTCGGTGGWLPHIHYQTQEDEYLNGQSVQSTFIDAEEPDRIPKLYGFYTSINTYNPLNDYRVGKYSNGYVWDDTSDYRPYSRPFPVTYFHNQGADMLGYPINNVYLLEDCMGCDAYGADKVYVQDFQGGATGSSTLVMNMLTYNTRFDYLGVVYPIHGHIRDYWYLHFSELGAPVSNEHGYDGYDYYSSASPAYVVQWFEPSDNNYVAVVYNNSNGTYEQYGQYDSGAPPCTVLDQAKWENLGCPNGDCGTGGGPMITDPTNLTASVLSDTEIELVYNLPETTQSGNWSVKVYEHASYKGTYPLADHITISGLTPGEWYCYRVSVVNNDTSQESDLSNEACATTSSSPPPPPPSVYTYLNSTMCEGVEASAPHNYINSVSTFPKSPGAYAYAWYSLSSTDPNLSFSWKLYYYPESSGVCDATQGAGCPYAYLPTSSSYYDAANDEYRVWHYFSANGLPDRFGQYRVELWVNGQKAEIMYFNLILETPARPNLNGDPTVEEVNLVSYPVSGAAKQELYRDNDYIGDFDYHLFKDTNVVPGATHEYRVMEVSADGFRSELSEIRFVEIPSDADSDGDGTPDSQDNCPNDPNKTEPGVCGCNVSDVDTDGDGIADCVDAYPNDPNNEPPITQELVIQPGPSDGIDCWVTNVYYDGGLDNERLVAGGWGDYYHSLIKFDLSGLLENVNSVILRLYQYNLNDSYTDMYLDRVSSDWTEATKWANKPLHINLGTLPAPTGIGWYDIDITNLYNDWQSGTVSNYGIQLRPVSVAHKFNNFHSSDYLDDPNLRPKLVITYEDASSGDPDPDTDGDGTPDSQDNCPNDPNKTEPGVCGCNVSDVDTDGDGVADCVDNCPTDSDKINPGQCGCNNSDQDSDNDGVVDCIDDCPSDPSKTTPDVCGCNVADTDTDGDGIADCVDAYPNDPNNEPPTPLSTNWWISGGSMDNQNASADFHIASSPQNPWDNAFGTSYSVVAGNTYRLKFSARADNYTGDSMQVIAGINNNGPVSWYEISDNAMYYIDGTEIEYVVDLIATETDTSANVYLNVGYDIGDIYFTYISLEEIEGNTNNIPAPWILVDIDNPSTVGTANYTASGSGSGTVTFDSNAQTSHTGEPSTVTWDHTVGTGENGLAIVCVSGLSEPSAPTWGGLPMTLISSESPTKCYYLLSPDTDVTAQVSVSGGNIKVGGSMVFFGVDQSDPIGTVATENNSGSPNGMALTTEADNSMRVDILGANRDDAVSATASLDSGTMRFNDVVPQNQFRIGLFGYATLQETAGTVTPEWTTTGTNRKYLAFEIKAAVAVGGQYTLSGSGNDLWGSGGQYTLLHQALNGDGEIVARITSQTNTNDWAKAGVIIVESTATDAQNAIMAVTPANGYAFQYNYYGHTSGGGYSFPNAWVKLVRSGDTITGYVSSDGNSWTYVSSVNIYMSAEIQVGLFVASHDSNQVATVTFDNVIVTGSGTSSTSVELLDSAWNLSGSNGSDEKYQSIDSDALNGMESVTITYNLNGLCALGGDASAIIFDQNGWQYVSLSDYGNNCYSGEQTVTIPLSDFGGLDPESDLTGSLHTRFWYGSAFAVDIISIKANPM